MEKQDNLNRPEKSPEQDSSQSYRDTSTNQVEIRKRSAIFPQKKPARFQEEKAREKLVMTFPNLIVRELICFHLVVIVVALISLFFNAPLEELANPNNTPNPAKAPWYFLGIQELLHIFPPVVAGVIIPTLVVIALMVLPYMKINIKRKGLWEQHRNQTILSVSIFVFVITGMSLIFKAFSIAGPTLLLYFIALLPFLFQNSEKRWIKWLARRTLADWIMTWFVLVVIVLTIIGTYFRGPGWSWIWPWG